MATPSFTTPGAPLTMAALKTFLDAALGALLNVHRGASAPDSPVEGMFWWDTSATPSEVLKRYTATGWISLVTVNITTGAVSFQGVDLSTYLAKSTYTAQSILAATLSATPAAVTVAEQTLVGRTTGGNITALSVAQVLTLLDIANTYVAKSLFDANSILVANSDNTPIALTIPEDRIVGRVSGGNIAALTGAQAATIIGSTGSSIPVTIGIVCSDESTPLTTGTAKATFRMPHAMTLTAVRASVSTAPVGAKIYVDINEGGKSILSATELTIDPLEKTSTTAESAAVITDAALADDAEITIDIDQVGNSKPGAGLKVWLIGTRTL